MDFVKLAKAIDCHISRREILRSLVNSMTFDQFESQREEDVEDLAHDLGDALAQSTEKL